GRALLGLALEDIDEQRGDSGGGERGDQQRRDVDEDAAAGRCGGRRHGASPCSRAVCGPPTPAGSPWPRPGWQCTEATSPRPATRSCTSASWQRRQLCSRIAEFFGVMRIGSGKSWRVKPFEWCQPFVAFAAYLATKVVGRWQSTQVALVWWLA